MRNVILTTSVIATLVLVVSSVALVHYARAIVSCTFTRDLTVGSTGDDVLCLQQYLNDGGGAIIATSGPGSPGNETTYFGSLTQNAVARWQSANNISPAAGYFGPVSRAKYYELLQASTTQPTTQPSGGTPTTQQPLAINPGSGYIERYDFSPVNVYWSYTGLQPGSTYQIVCSPPVGASCRSASGQNLNQSYPVSSSGAGQGQYSSVNSNPLSPTANVYGVYSFTIVGQGTDGSSVSSFATAVIIQQPPQNPQQQPQQPQQPGQPPITGSGCGLLNLGPCFDLFQITAITPALPNCNFTATPSTIVPPQGSTLSWTCSNAESCTLDQGIGSVKAPSGAYSVTPAKTTTYNLTCSNPDGDNTFSTTVTVAKPFIKEVRP